MWHRRLAPAVALAFLGFPPPALPQSDLDALMRKVLARRDDNWKKLQQYVLEERDVIDVRGSSNRRASLQGR